MPKTASTSLCRAFRQLGYRHCGHNNTQMDRDIVARFSEYGILLEDDRQQLLRWTADCDVFCDYPFGHATGYPLALKRAAWPKAKYVWIDRNLTEWAASFGRWYPSKQPSSHAIASYTHHRNEFVRASPFMDSLMLDIAELNWSAVTQLAFGAPCTVKRPFPWANANTQAGASEFFS